MAPLFELTPSQESFLTRHIPQFTKKQWSITLAAQAGSDRRFVRIQHTAEPGRIYIMIVWDSSDHDWPRFHAIAQDVATTHALLPSVYASEASHGLILEEDLGDMRLKDFVLQCSSAQEVESAYRTVLDALLVWHSHRVAADSVLAQRQMDIEMFLWETGYFAAHCATEYFGLEKMLTANWESERWALAKEAAGLAHVCMHRDFQSENVMMKQGRVRFVDYQGARLGPAEYDAAALLYDPYVTVVDSTMADNLFEYYVSHSPVAITLRGFQIAAAQRLLQALGAFANLSLHKGKDWYRAFVPIALPRLAHVLERLGDFPHILDIVRFCIKAQ